MYEQAFDRIDDLLRTTTCQTELDYIEQTSWLLFLKYLDGQEKEAETTAKLSGKTYKHILDPQYRWGAWAMPKDKAGNLLHDKAMNGDDLIAFVEGKLFPYLRKFKERADSADTVEYKIGAIFSEMRNKVNSGFTLRDILAIIDGLEFGSRDDKHELSALYEEKIRNMGNAGRNGGEYYTPRPLIRAMIKVIEPQVGEKVYDGAVGSAGFLCEAYEYMSAGKLTTAQKTVLSERTFYGKEKKPLAYVIAIMNLMLHGVKAPNIINTNTLAENINDIQEKDRYEVVLANPPFGGKEREEVQENLPIKTSETASLFLQHFIKILKAGGRGAIVIKNTFLSNTDNGSVAYARNSSQSVTCTPSSTAPPARSRAPASRPSSCSSTRVSRPRRSGSTNSIPAARWARPVPSRTPTSRTSSNWLRPTPSRPSPGPSTSRTSTPRPATCLCATPTPPRRPRCVAPPRSSPRSSALMKRAPTSSRSSRSCYEGRLEDS